jgi:hypothetical protein
MHHDTGLQEPDRSVRHTEEPVSAGTARASVAVPSSAELPSDGDRPRERATYHLNLRQPTGSTRSLSCDFTSTHLLTRLYMMGGRTVGYVDHC